MNDVDGLSALVTGGAPGVARGAVLDLDPSGAGEPLLGHRAGVTDDPSGRAALAAAAADLGGLDVLVHDAGIGARGSVEDAEDYDDAEWHRVLDVDVVGLVRVARATLPPLRRSAHAAIVDTCSTAATAGLPRRALRGAAKGTVYSLALALAVPGDHVREGIRVDRLAPGTADTPWIGRLLHPAPDPVAERTALGPAGPPAAWSTLPRSTPPGPRTPSPTLRAPCPAPPPAPRSPSTAACRACGCARRRPGERRRPQRRRGHRPPPRRHRHRHPERPSRPDSRRSRRPESRPNTRP